MERANVHNSTEPSSTSCYILDASNPNRIWKSGAVLENEGPLLALQLAFTIFTSNFFYYILRPLRQPRLVAEVLAGFTLSPLCLGYTSIGNALLPTKGILNMETYGHMGLMCYVFLTGLEMNLDTILQIRKKAISIAIAGIIIPVAIGVGLFAVIQQIYEKPAAELYFHEDDRYTAKAYLFWSLALTVTGFPVLARVLTDLKLLSTKLGKAALSAAMISDTYGWVLFIILIPFASNDERAILSVLSTILFILICIFALRPLITQFIDRKVDLDTWNNSQLVIVLMGALVCSYITDALGSHSIVGAFVYGLILPNGKFADLVMGKLDDFVNGIISPLFFFRSGLTVNLVMVAQQKYWPLMALVILLLFIPKVLSTLVATFFFSIPARDGLGIGLLLNSKGVLALIILNIAWDRKILSVVSFSIMVCAVFLMTITAPIFINAIYNPRKRFEMYKLRTVQKLRDTELRILTCVHNNRQAASMVSVLETCNATRISPFHVFGVHLVEFKGRATTLFAAHIEQSSHAGAQNLSQSQNELESITNTFNVLAELNNAVRVETTYAMSAYETIHEDIHGLAEQKLTSLILLPFHKQPDVEGGLETTNAAYRDINLNVLQDAPCSVAIFVDRGIGSLSRINLRILMLFIGGPDDREALAITWRMAGHPGTQLSMVRILLSGEAAEVDVSLHDEAHWLSSAIIDDERQNFLDEEYLDSFRLKVVNNNESVTYSEEEVNSGEELTSLVHEFGKDDYDLIIVGRGNNRNSKVFSNFLEWCDNPELGVIGDIVASNNFSSRSSLLVVQQYESGSMESGTQTRQPRQLPANSDGSETLVVNTF